MPACRHGGLLEGFLISFCIPGAGESPGLTVAYVSSTHGCNIVHSWSLGTSAGLCYVFLGLGLFADVSNASKISYDASLTESGSTMVSIRTLRSAVLSVDIACELALQFFASRCSVAHGTRFVHIIAICT